MATRPVTHQKTAGNSGGEGTAQEKIAALEAVGVTVAKLPTDIAQLVKERLGSA